MDGEGEAKIEGGDGKGEWGGSRKVRKAHIGRRRYGWGGGG